VIPYDESVVPVTVEELVRTRSRASLGCLPSCRIGRHQATGLSDRNYFFASGCQFWIRVIGASAPSSSVLIRKRPSGETTY
jgi:hypothetical protein